MSDRIASIKGVFGYVPDYVLTNAELETMVDTSDEWITTRTGIKERRLLKDGRATSDMGYEMVRGLLEKSGTSPDEIGCLICATITGDMIFPDTANTICDKAGIKNAFGYDINAACSGFLYALTTAAKIVESGMVGKAIVVGVDMMSSIIDYEDRTTCVIFGDGGGAVLLEPSSNGEGIKDSFLRGDGSGREFLHMKAGGSKMPPSAKTVESRVHYVYQDGAPVFKSAVRGMCDAVTTVMERNNLSSEQIDWLVPHQANKRIIQSVSSMLDFPEERVMINIHRYGNTTAGTLPLCLSDWEDKLKIGDKIILTAFGGGFTWGATYLTWAY